MISWTIDFWKRVLQLLLVQRNMVSFYASAFMPLPLGARGIMFSGWLSIWNNLFPPVHGSVGPSDQPWPFFGLSFHLCVRLFVCPDRFLHISQRTHGEKGLKFCMLMYPDHLQKWLDFGHGLLIFFLLPSLWLRETSQIWGFRAFPGECMEGRACNFACWCILTTFRTD